MRIWEVKQDASTEPKAQQTAGMCVIMRLLFVSLFCMNFDSTFHVNALSTVAVLFCCAPIYIPAVFFGKLVFGKSWAFLKIRSKVLGEKLS